MHAFWETQPVPSPITFGQVADKNPVWIASPTLNSEKNGQVAFFKKEDIRDKPFELPEGFEWKDFDIATKQYDVHQMMSFLHDFYSTDPGGKFRLTYSEAVLKWILCPNGYRKEFHIGIISTKTRELIGMITGTPVRCIVNGTVLETIAINFLCVRPFYRHKNLAPILIREVSRRIGLVQIWHAVYTSSLDLPHVVAKANYYHRPLNTKKLLHTGFCQRHNKLTGKGTIKYYQMDKKELMSDIREMDEKDISRACSFLNSQLQKYDMRTSFKEDEFRQFFMTRKSVVYSYVVESRIQPKGPLELVGFVSFYETSMTVDHSKEVIFSANLLYCVGEKLSLLMSSALILAEKIGFDVFTCTDIMSNSEFFQECKFTQGSGKTNYYLYNWKSTPMEAKKVGFVLP